MERPERAETLRAHLAQRLGVWFLSDPEKVGDMPPRTFVEPLGKDWAFLAHMVLKDLNLRLYPRELCELGTVDELADYLAQELEPIPADAMSSGEELAQWRWDEAPPPAGPPAVGTAFVLSTPRSGSTLLRVMLAGSPELFAPPELWLLPFGTMVRRDTQLDANDLGFLGLGLGQCASALWGEAEGEVRLAGWRERDASVGSIYNDLRERSGARWLVDKTPGYCADTRWLAQGERVTRNARYLFLVRHPYPVVESFLRMRFHRMIGPNLGLWDDDPYRFAANAWDQWNRRIATFLDTVPEDRRLMVRYEDIVEAPEPTLSRIADFLGVAFVSAMVSPYGDNRMTFEGSRHVVTTGDPNFARRERLDQSLARWQHLELPQQVRSAVQETASTLGYEMP
jgi:hypothetical protein